MNVFIRILPLLILILTTSRGLGSPPNILFLFTDDQRFDSFGAMGNPDVKTPHMDRLIRQGTLFTNAYIQGSMVTATCLPSRAMIMSGKSLFRAPMQLDSGTLLPQAFRAEGYTTFATGKWHNGVPSFLRCFGKAEAVFFGGAAGTHLNVPLNYLENGLMHPYWVPGVDDTVLYADAVIHFLQSEASQSRPFFCYVPFTAPHSPYQAPDEYVQRYVPERLTLPPNVNLERAGSPSQRPRPFPRQGRSNGDSRTRLAQYYAMVTHLDHQIGRILEGLTRSGHARNTIVVLATDHGYSLGSHGERGKANGYEHGSRALISFSGPGIPEGERRTALVYLLDLYPTLCDLAGITLPPDLDGLSLAPAIRGDALKTRDTLFTAFMADQRTIRDERWKLFHRTRPRTSQLFDLINDPHELNDLAPLPQYADTLKRLHRALAQARRDAGETPERVQELMQRRGRSGARRHPAQ